MSTTLTPTSSTPVVQKIYFPTIESKKDPYKTMKAVEWYGTGNVKVVDRPRPLVTDPKDCVIRVTSTTICGSDLHLYHHEMKGMQKGDVLGHEFMGVVEAIGPEVKDIKVGDRVVTSFCIACGNCEYCKKGLWTSCDTTNPSKEMETMYGHRTAGLFGYSHLTGGYDGGQAEFVRVPFADVNCLKITGNKDDEYYLFLTDVLCTGWHATEMAEIKPGNTVVIWGCGPIGLASAMWAKYRGASRIIAIDGVDYRLKIARNTLGCDIIDYRQESVLKTIQNLLPGGPDCVIDAVGFRFPKTFLHKLERAVKLETDSPQILSECIYSVKKGGIVSIIGDYIGFANHFPIGALMEKGLTIRGSQAPVHKYWKDILQLIESGKVDPTFLVSHRMDLNDAAEAYRIFDEKEDESIKIVLRPKLITSTTSPI